MSVIETAMDDTETPPGDRLRAAFKVLELCGGKEAANQPGPIDAKKIRREEKMSRDMDALMAM